MRLKSIAAMIIGVLILTPFMPLQTYADGKFPVTITDQSNIIYPIDANTLEVMQITTVKNSGTNKEAELPIYLPKGYANMQIRGGLAEENMKKTDKGIVDTSGLAPGEEKKIMVSYQMPMTKDSAHWSVELPYVAESIQIIIQPGVMSFEASDLVTQSDLFEMNGQKFRRFTRVDLHPNIPWTLSFRLIPGSTSKADTQQSPATTKQPEADSKYTSDGIKIIGTEGFGYGKAAVMVIIIIIAFAAALIGLKRDLQNTLGVRKQQGNNTWLLTEKEDLLRDVAQLEKDFQAKLISESTYENAIENIRQKLIEITTELQKRSAS